MSVIPLDHKRTPLVRIAEIYSKRRYGAVLDSGPALLHNRKVLMAVIETRVAHWDALDVPGLRIWESFQRGVDPDKLREISNRRRSTVYSESEWAAIRYAVAMTETPPEVTDEMVADLRMRFTDAQVVELTAMIALKNQRSRTNIALGDDQPRLPQPVRSADRCRGRLAACRATSAVCIMSAIWYGTSKKRRHSTGVSPLSSLQRRFRSFPPGLTSLSPPYPPAMRILSSPPILWKSPRSSPMSQIGLRQEPS